MGTPTIDKLLSGDYELYTESEIMKRLTDRTRDVLRHIIQKNQVGIMPTARTILDNIKYGNMQLRTLLYVLEHRLKKGVLIVGIPFNELVEKYNVKPSGPHKKFGRKMELATGCFGYSMNWPHRYDDTIKFYVAMSKDEDGNPTFKRVLANSV